MTHKAILFDLDGTLVDTAPDIIDAVNIVLSHYKKPNIPVENIRPYISLGSMMILAEALHYKNNDDRLPHLRQQLFDAYVPIMTNKSRLFPGLGSLLEKLKKKNKPWGIVTNKPEWVAKQLIKELHYDKECQCVIGPETTNTRKPDPDGLLHACRILRLAPSNVTYVGDCEHDILAAKRAGMKSIAVSWGYYPAESKPEDWGADHLCHTAEELSDLL